MLSLGIAVHVVQRRHQHIRPFLSLSSTGYVCGEGGEYESFHPVLSVLSYLIKAPLVPPGTPVVNALFKQRCCIENGTLIESYPQAEVDEEGLPRPAAAATFNLEAAEVGKGEG